MVNGFSGLLPLSTFEFLKKLQEVSSIFKSQGFQEIRALFGGCGSVG
jgi:hypothetical protein